MIAIFYTVKCHEFSKRAFQKLNVPIIMQEEEKVVLNEPVMRASLCWWTLKDSLSTAYIFY
jgi:hypothetical protein